MNFLPKVKKGLASVLSKTEKVRKAVLGVALAATVALATGTMPSDASAAQSTVSASSPVLLSAAPETLPGYHYSHSSLYSHASHQSHQSHFSSRY